MLDAAREGKVAACGTEQMYAPIARAGGRALAEAIADGRSEVSDLLVGVRVVFSSAAKAEDSELSEERAPEESTEAVQWGKNQVGLFRGDDHRA